LEPATYKFLTDDDRKSAKKLILRKLKNSAFNSVTSTSSSMQTTRTTTKTTNESNPLYELAVLCGHTVSFPTSTVSRQSMTLDEELSAYIEAARSNKNFREFWMSHEKTLPRLAHLVKQTHIIPATSVASEALFSIASFINRKQRSSLSSRTLRYLLVLKDRHLLDKFDSNCRTVLILFPMFIVVGFWYNSCLSFLVILYHILFDLELFKKTFWC
jgi:hypothetical protein